MFYLVKGPATGSCPARQVLHGGPRDLSDAFAGTVARTHDPVRSTGGPCYTPVPVRRPAPAGSSVGM
jgi:hypothetical protein